MLDTTMKPATEPGDDGAHTTAYPSDAREKTAFDALMAMPETIEALPKLPGHFTLGQQGIEMHTTDPKGNAVTLWLCAPLVVIGRARTVDGDEWCTVARFLDKDLEMRQLVLADGDLHAGTGAVIKQLVQRGLHVSGNKLSREGLIDLLRSWNPMARHRLVSSLGWTDANFSAFVLGDGSVVGDAKVLPRPYLGAFLDGHDHVSGTLEHWKSKISALCSGNPLMITAVSLAFCGSLLEPMGMEGGGLHLRDASSSGKSTLLRLANSVWGKTASLHAWNGTKNALEAIAASHSGRMLALDEIGEADGRSVSNTAYALANGQGRLRLTSSITLQDLNWRLAVLSSGEVSLAEHMSGAGKMAKAGQEVRLLDIPTDLETRGVFLNLHGRADTRTFARDVNALMEHAHGTAGPAFVAGLVKYLPTQLDSFRKAVADFSDKVHAALDLPEDGMTARAIQRFALISLAGEFATWIKITGWQKGVATDAAIEALRLWVLGRDLATRDEVSETIRRLEDYVSANQNQLTPLNTAKSPLPKGFVGWFDRNRYYFG